jgi:hypothetical protein
MKHSLLVFALLIVFGTGAVAEETNPFNGKWNGKVIQANGKAIAAELVVKEDGGTWVLNFESTRHVDPCAKAQRSIAVSRKAANELEFVVQHAQFPGCTDFSLTLHRVDDKTLEGKAYGLEYSFVRQ